MRNFVIQECSIGNEYSLDGANPNLTDTYSVEGSLQDAIERLAEVSEQYGDTYSHRLIEVIPVNIERRNASDRNETVATCGDVRVTTTAK